MKDIVIVGAGGFGREVKMLIDQINATNKEYNFLGFYDDGFEKGTIINGFPVLGGVEDLRVINSPLNILLAIGTPAVKQKILNNILSNKNLQFPTLIHPSVFIGNDNVKIGRGTIICAGCIITVNIEIGDFVILNLACTVGHDTKIGNNCAFMPSVNISGEVIIEPNVYVGTGAKIINQIDIGTNTIIGAGAVVSKKLPANCTAVGVPAKPIKINN